MDKGKKKPQTEADCHISCAEYSLDQAVKALANSGDCELCTATALVSIGDTLLALTKLIRDKEKE